MVKYGKDKKMDPADAKALPGHVSANLEITMDAKTAYEQFKAAKADANLTNGEIVTRHNQLYEKQRLAKLAGDAAAEKAKNAELVAEVARLKAQLEKGKAAKAA